MRGLLMAFLALDLAGRCAPAGGRVRGAAKTDLTTKTGKTTVTTV